MSNSHPLLNEKIEIKKNMYIEKLNSTYNGSDEIIVESLGAFDKQYELSNNLSIIAYDMFCNHIEKNVINVEEYNLWLKTIILNVYANNGIITNFSAKILNIGTDSVEIEINIPSNVHLKLNPDKSKKMIKNCIVHELMHDNIFLKRYNNNVKNYDDTPNDYATYIEIMQNENPDSIFYKIGLALYSTFYQEMQAIVSQTSSDLSSLLYQQDSLTNADIRNYIKQTDGYNRYQIILNNLVNVIENTSDNEIKNISSILYKRYGLNINIKKEAKKWKYKSEQALKNIMRNAMLIANGIGERIKEK